MSEVNMTSEKNQSQSSARRSGFRQRFGSSRSSTRTRVGRFSSTSAPRGDWLRPSGKSVTPFAVSHSTVFQTGPRRTPKSTGNFGFIHKAFDAAQNLFRHEFVAADDEDKFFVRDAFSELEGFEADSPERVPEGAACSLCGAARGLDVYSDTCFVVRDEVEQTDMVRLQRRHGFRVVEVKFHKEFGIDECGVGSALAVVRARPRFLDRHLPKFPNQASVRSDRRFILLPNRADEECL